MAEIAELKDHGIDIRKLLKDGKLSLGTKSTLKRLREGKLKSIFVTKNCPEEVKEDVAQYSKIAGVEVIQLEQPNDELGTMCKKPFGISVAGVLK